MHSFQNVQSLNAVQRMRSVDGINAEYDNLKLMKSA